MSINTLSDWTTRRNRTKIVKETTFTWLNFSGTFKINVYSNWTYNTPYLTTTGQVLTLYNKYVVNSVFTLDPSTLKMWIAVCWIPNDNTAKFDYSVLNFWGSTWVQSVYLNWDLLAHNYQEWTGNFRCQELDLTTWTWTKYNATHDTWTILTNDQVSFMGYQVISDVYVDSTWWYNITPYFKFAK